jgi:hypothetical protein
MTCSLKCIAFALVATALLRSSASAVLISKDDPIHGADSITLDSSTKLEWLDVRNSLGLSYNQVAAEFVPGGQFAGFRHATNAEITTLFQNAGIPIIATSGYWTANYQPVRDLQDLVTSLPGSGGSQTTWTTRGHAAATIDPDIGWNSWLRFLDRQEPANDAIANEGGTISTSPDSSFPLTGHWLVRPVPEPAAALSACAAAAFVLTRRRIMRMVPAPSCRR